MRQTHTILRGENIKTNNKTMSTFIKIRLNAKKKMMINQMRNRTLMTVLQKILPDYNFYL